MKYFFLCLSFFVSHWYIAQSRQLYHQYMLNPGYFNPANIDVQTRYGGTMTYINDYAGMSESPKGIGLYGHYNLKPSQGVAASLINDNFGKYNQLEVSGSYAYKIWPKGKGVCYSLGARFGFSQHSLNQEKLSYESSRINGYLDPTLDDPKTASLGISLGFGGTIITRNFDFNISMPSITRNKLPSSATDTTRSLFDLSNGTLFIHSGYKFRSRESWFVFYPTILMKTAGDGVPLQFGGDLNFLINQIVWTSVGYRSDNTLTSSLGIFSDLGFRVIYSYHSALLSAHASTKFSHEISLGYALTLPDPFYYRQHLTRSGKWKYLNIFKKATNKFYKLIR